MRGNDFGVTATALRPDQVFDGRLLHIPSYQRGYAWQRQQWDEFVEDLELIPEGRVHYTGTVVLHSTGNEPVRDKHGKQYQVVEVVDGQQRLTTIVLLLDAVRRELERTGQNDLAEGIKYTFISATDRANQPLPKLRLNEDTHIYFFDHILHDKPCLDGNRIRSHRNLSEAKAYFTKYLNNQSQKLGEGYAAWLERLWDKITHHLSLTVYAVNDESDAGVLFEVMNNRGKPITELEKVKNYLLYLASKLQLDSEHDLARRINSTWAHIFQRLMSSGLGSDENEDQLLRVHWLMTYDPAEKNWRGSKSLKQEFHLREFVGKHDELLKKLIEYVDGLRDAATAFCDVACPRHPDAFGDLRSDVSVRKSAMHFGEKLPRLRVLAPFLPLLIAVRLRHPGDGTKYVVALNACERYAFRVYRLLQKRSNAGRSSLILTGNALFDGEYTFDQAMGVVISLILKYSPNYDVEQAFELKAARNWYKWTGLKYFLYEYEQHRAEVENRNLAIAWSILEADEAKNHTIEHILPQTPTDEYWLSRFDGAHRKTYTHDLGNLCLTLDNSSYGNKPFPGKRGSAADAGRCYAKGDLVMERDLAAVSDWTEASLLTRRTAVVAWAKSRWGVEEPPAQVPAVADEDADDSDAGLDVVQVDAEAPILSAATS